MRLIHPDYASFLRTLAGLGPTGNADTDRWRALLLASEDLLSAAARDDAAAAKTEIAKATRSVWPDSSKIPSGARASLGVLRVDVRW